METGCQGDACRRLEPADQGERAEFRVCRLRDGGGEGGGEAQARLQGGERALALNGGVHVCEGPALMENAVFASSGLHRCSRYFR